MPARKADAVILTDKQKEFADIHLARGASPRAIAMVLNSLSDRTPLEIRTTVRAPTMQFDNWNERKTWEGLAGGPKVKTYDVRRELDRLRKTSGGLNVSRRAVLARYDEERRRNIALARVTHIHYPSARVLHDLGMARRFGASPEVLSDIAGDESIPEYLESA